MKTFVVYEHWRPDEGRCFYVGKGIRRRARQMNARNRHHLGIQNKLASLGLRVDVRIIADDLTEDGAFALEIERIKYWSDMGYELANHTLGGGGVSGFKLTDEQKAKISLTHRGVKRSKEWAAKIGDALRGRPKSESHRHNCRLGQIGKVISAETREKLSRALTGRTFSPETIERKRASLIRYHATVDRSEIHKKIGDAQRGVKRKPHSPETKAKMAVAALRWRAERRAAKAVLSLSQSVAATANR